MTATSTNSATANTSAAVGTIAGCTTPFLTAYRDGNRTPVAFYATVTLPLSYEDLVAAVWVLTEVSDLDEIAALSTDLHDRYNIYALVLETVTGAGLDMAQARADIANVQPGTADHAALTVIRGLVADAFGSPDPPPAVPAPRRTHRRPATDRRSLVAVA